MIVSNSLYILLENINTMEAKTIVGASAGLLALITYARYWRLIIKKQVRPSRGTWAMWFSIDTVLSIVYGLSGAPAAIFLVLVFNIGAGVTFILSFFYGAKTESRFWREFEMYVTGSAMIALAMIVLAAILVEDGFQPHKTFTCSMTFLLFVGTIPTIVNALKKPWEEDKLAWLLFTVAAIGCITSLGNPANWTMEKALLPISYLIVDLVIFLILPLDKNVRDE